MQLGVYSKFFIHILRFPSFSHKRGCLQSTPAQQTNLPHPPPSLSSRPPNVNSTTLRAHTFPPSHVPIPLTTASQSLPSSSPSFPHRSNTSHPLSTPSLATFLSPSRHVSPSNSSTASLCFLGKYVPPKSFNFSCNARICTSFCAIVESRCVVCEW